MSEQYPALLVIVPLLSAFIISAAGWVNKRLCFPIAVAALSIATYSSIGLLLRVLSDGVVLYRFGGWDPPWGIAYYVDHLNGLVLVVVSVVALINLIAGRKSIELEFPEKTGAFYALYLLFVTGLLGIVVTGGSDSHGPGGTTPVEVGQVGVPDECAEALRQWGKTNGRWPLPMSRGPVLTGPRAEA